jgi:hypothetical protein
VPVDLSERIAVGRLRTVFTIAWLFWGGTAAAQPAAIAPAPSTATFLTRADYSFQWAAFFTPDPRFEWNGRVGVDIDLFDNRQWRLNFGADYDAVLGRERRPFDLNQGTYAFDGVVARRITPVIEVAAVARHVSRHLTDRDNRPAISWNVAAARIDGRGAVGRLAIGGSLESGRAMQQAFVDYLWMSRLRLQARRPIFGRVDLFGAGIGEVFTVDRTIAHRGRVCGGRVEGGIRFQGAAGSVEVFAGYERRIDAFPTDRFRVRSFVLGFRLVGD